MEVHCDRCQKNLTQLVNLSQNSFTIGYYEVGFGFWSQFADKDEVYLCDACMWKDQRYIRVYGHYSGVEYEIDQRGRQKSA